MSLDWLNSFTFTKVHPKVHPQHGVEGSRRMMKDREIQAAIKTVQAETETEITLNDGAEGKGTGSLKLVVRKTGKGVAALWYAAWKSEGVRKKKQLGRYPDLSLADARKLFRDDVSPLIQSGKNPKAVAKVATPSVQALFQGYVAQLKADGKRSADDIADVLLNCKNNCADGLGRDMMAADVEPSGVAAFLAKAFKRNARRMADMQRTYMAAAFNWGIQSTHDYRTEDRGDWGIKFNPVMMVPKDAGANKTRDRNLAAWELAGLWAELASGRFSLEVSSAIMLIICCGQRVRETLRVDGREIDLEAATWNMPAPKTKGGEKPHTIPLPGVAVEIFRKLIARHGQGPLFPAGARSKQPLIADISLNQAIRRWLANEGNEVEHLITKDLRRTWKSRAHDAGVDRFTRDLIQQHSKGDTGSKFYDMADYLPQMREAMTKWELWLETNVVNKQQLAIAA